MANFSLVYLGIGLIFSFLINYLVIRKRQVSPILDIFLLLVVALFWLPILAASLYVSIKRSLNE